MLVLSIFIAFICLLVLPLISAYLVYLRKKGTVLFINQDKIRDPRYFAKSFSALIQNSEIESQTNEVMLSKPEKFDRVGEPGFEKQQYENLVYSSIQKLTLAPEYMTFNKEIYADGDVCLAGNTVLRSLYATKNLIIGNGVFVGRWADAEGTVTAYDNCNLGVSLTSASSLCVGSNCVFQRLYAPEIMLGVHPQEDLSFGSKIPDFALTLNAKNAKERNIKYVMDDMKDDNGVVPYTLITNQNLVVTEGLIVQGHIRSEKGVHLSEGVIVCGNLFAEENIILGRNTHVLGAVFTQGSVTLEDGATIGRKGEITSLVARDDICVNGRARIYGYVSCDGKGSVNETPDGEIAVPAYEPENYSFLYLPGGAVPQTEIAASNERLRMVSRDELHRFAPPAKQQEPSAVQTVRPKTSRPKRFAALAGILLVLVLGAFALSRNTAEPSENPEILSVDLYRNQGLTHDMQLETEPLNITDDYIVFADRVLQRFHASADSVALDAAVYDSLLDLVPANVNKYTMLVPLRIYYEENFKSYGGDMEAAASQFASLLPGTKFINLFDKLPAGNDKYIFYRSEPYWTAAGAYYGASAFLAEKGVSLPALTEYRESLYSSFKGSLFNLDGQSKGEDATYNDRTYMYISPSMHNQEILYRRQDDGSYIKSLEPIISKSRTGMSVFVGTPTFSHAILEGSVKNGKTLLLIGDSSAKIMASYFTDTYETVYVINQTWYSQDESTFSDIFKDYSVEDVLIVESIGALGDEQNRLRTYRIVRDNNTAQK